MVTSGGTGFIELDPKASTDKIPYGIITADCSSPREIDDGIFVEPLPTDKESYRVGVCVVDTSRLYGNSDVLRQALRNTEAKYWALPNGQRGYEPMIDPDAIRDIEFRAGRIRNALIVSFIVGNDQPLSDVDVSFGKIEVVKNLNYKNFGKQCRYNDRYEKFGRASAYIMKHLQFASGGDDRHRPDVSAVPNAAYERLIHVPAQEVWSRGARINESYMVAAGHVVGLLMAAENRPAIYRVHDPDNEEYLEFMPANIARFSRVPGPHSALNLEPYCRVTSPLRRLEDFMMNYQLKQRDLGRIATSRDTRDLAAAVQRLNQKIIETVAKGPLRLNESDTLGKRATTHLMPIAG